MGPLASRAVTAYLGLGANVGDRLANLEWALELLNATGGITVVKCSSIYETEPWGVKEQPRFLNAVVEVQTTLEPGALLSAGKEIEGRVGRVATVRYGPRTIDVDILLYGCLVVDWQTPDLQIPHPRMAERAFVLVPLAEIGGEIIHPLTKESIGKMEASVEGRQGVIPWGEGYSRGE
jgi:2-amino-4-hydroxy-6-hydroxymethyldihydropteridine diphosphokinase